MKYETLLDPAVSLLELVNRQVFSAAQAVAVSADSEVLTYAELDRQSNQLAHYLISAGVGREHVVALHLKRSPAFIVAALATLKSGAAYLPLDPDTPTARVAFMLQDSGISAVVTSEELRGRVPSGVWRVVDLARDGAQIRRQVAHAPGTEIHSEDLAYVIYTSGSTGQPKGVEVTHSSLSNMVTWQTRAFELTPADRASFMASVGFDPAVWELWPYLAAGVGLHVPKDVVRKDAKALRKWLLEQNITVCLAPTAMAESLLKLEWPTITPLRILSTGGDYLRLRPSPTLPFTLVNNYGPTEYTVVATSGVVEPARNNSLPSIGRPIDNTTVYILDEAMREVLQGEAGELYLAGAGLARGYRNRPQLTTQHFVANPFGQEGSRLYRTGDLARVLPNGEIEFLGRVDEQVKVRGFRIEPNEITAALNSCEGVQTSTVVARQDHRGEKRLIAYIVKTAGSSLTAPELRDQLSKVLPDYMIPTAFVQVDEIPTTMNDKVDRQALPEPNTENMLSEKSYVAPQSMVEVRLAAIISLLLDVGRVGVNDSLFLLCGGHYSLLATQIVTLISDSFGVRLALRSLFDHPTLGEISAEIERLIVEKIEANAPKKDRERRLVAEHKASEKS